MWRNNYRFWMRWVREYAATVGILGSVDANRNDLQSGWDTEPPS